MLSSATAETFNLLTVFDALDVVFYVRLQFHSPQKYLCILFEIKIWICATFEETVLNFNIS